MIKKMIFIRFLIKTYFLLEHRTHIELTEAQIKTIQDLKLQMKKDFICQIADMKNFILELESKRAEDKMDFEGANTIIDRAFASASTFAESSLKVYEKLKNILTPKQVAKISTLYEQIENKEKEEKIISDYNKIREPKKVSARIASESIPAYKTSKAGVIKE